LLGPSNRAGTFRAGEPLEPLEPLEPGDGLYRVSEERETLRAGVLFAEARACSIEVRRFSGRRSRCSEWRREITAAASCLRRPTLAPTAPRLGTRGRHAYAAGPTAMVALPDATKKLLSKVKYRLMRKLDLAESESAIYSASDRYWNGSAAGDLKDLAHWRGAGTWQDDERWVALGKAHVELAQRLATTAPVPLVLGSVIEWGSGGGANAAAFAEHCHTFYGIEVAQANLDECGRLLESQGFKGFKPVLIGTSSPDDALPQVREKCDFFLCTYVFELLPSKDYGAKVLGLAQQMLRPGGAALVQIRYDDGSDLVAAKKRDYERNATFFTSYPIHEFWLLAEQVGFTPAAVYLVPTADRYPHSGSRYAYFYLYKKP
jgi:hypothetical protein